MNPVDTARGCWVEPEHGQNYSEPLSPGRREVLLGKGRGGRRYSNLTINQEKELLDSFRKAKAGGVLVVSEIKVAAYEKSF